MSSGKTAWELVWGRYKEAPDTYPGVKEVLETLTPKGLFEEPSEYRPICNKKEEERLEKAIIALSSASSKDALAIVKTMAAEHAHRSIWVWATLGDSPLALAIGHLRDLAEVIESTGNPSTRETLAEYYTTQGWKADNSVLRALGAARSVSSTKAVTAAIRVVYLPWLEKVATLTQALASTFPVTGPQTCRTLSSAEGTVYLFADGLRMDLAKSLERKLDLLGNCIFGNPFWPGGSASGNG